MTINSAYLSGEEKIKGSLEVGKLADVIILDRNIIKTQDEQLKDIKVSMTILDGVIVYKA
jgi:predicted amidohydrolase YtcJ